MAMIKGVHISDIHFGAVPAKRLFNELDKVFITYIREMEKCDYVMINGDLTDHKLSLNDKDSFYLIKFMDKLIKTCVKKKVKKIRLIQGTISHDLNQLENFDHYSKLSSIDFRIVRTVEEEELFPEFKVLYVPEEYIEDSEAYYKEFLNKDDEYYQLITGHGTFDYMAFSNQKLESEKHIKNAPVFNLDEFRRITNGKIIFGHIHTPNQYKNMYYISSFTRWCFGEEQTKGFIEYLYSTKQRKGKVNRIVNKYARKYETIDVTDIFKNKDIDSEKKIKIIEKLKEEANADFVRVKFNKENLKDEGEILILKDYFHDDKVKLNITNNFKKEQNELEEELEKKYEFIFNKDYTLEKIISEYLRIHDNVILEPEKILSIINREK